MTHLKTNGEIPRVLPEGWQDKDFPPTPQLFKRPAADSPDPADKFWIKKASNSDTIQILSRGSAAAMSDASEYRRSRRGYRRLFSRQFSFSSAESSEEAAVPAAAVSVLKKSRTTREVRAHPVTKILEAPSKKATAKPEFLRYLEYIREAGSWAPDSDQPTIYFK